MHKHFFIVGAQRSATTYLATILDEHPEIDMAKPLLPEPKFFYIDKLYKKGLSYYQKKYFINQKGALRGDKSICYTEKEKSARRIKKHFPDAKILFVLRNPVERALSNYWYTRNEGLENLDLETAIKEKAQFRNYDKKNISVNPFQYLGRGLYLKQIKMYEKYFPKKSIKVLIHEELVNSKNLIFEVCAFIGTRRNFAPKSLGEKIFHFDRFEKTPTKIKSYLINYYSEHNKRLSKHLKLELREWWNY